MATLYWLTNDLRMDDNPALLAAAQDDALACIYCIDESWTGTDAFGNQRMGHHRQQFLYAALHDLSVALDKLGHRLNIFKGGANDVISGVLCTGQFNRVVCSRQHAYDETCVWDRLKKQHSTIDFEELDASTLYSKSQLTFAAKFPDSFSKFRKEMAAVDFRLVSAAPSQPVLHPT